MDKYNPSGKKESCQRVAWQIASEIAIAKRKDPLDSYEQIMECIKTIDKENIFRN